MAEPILDASGSCQALAKATIGNPARQPMRLTNRLIAKPVIAFPYRLSVA
jgi:hypothetical protein